MTNLSHFYAKDSHEHSVHLVEWVPVLWNLLPLQFFRLPPSLLLLVQCCSPTPTPTPISNLSWQVFLILHPLEFRWYISFKVPFFSHLLSHSPRPFSLENEVPRLRVSSARCMYHGQKYLRLHTWHSTLSLLSRRCIFSPSDFFSLSLPTQTQHTFTIHLPEASCLSPNQMIC